MKLFIYTLLTTFLFSGAREKIIPRPYEIKNKLYLALGDSYTTGESVYEDESFPYQLVSRLNASSVTTLEPELIAFTGWTSKNLLDAIEEKKTLKKYDFVTLLIGVNNQYSNLSKDDYRKEFNKILNIAISHSIGGRATVYVISIPDWSATPHGRTKDFNKVTLEIDKFNAINKEESLNEGVHYIDITSRSRATLTDKSLVSIDNLHPSAKFYREWVDILHPLVRRELYF